MTKSKFKFERFYFLNRWKQPSYARNDNWVIIGIYKWWSSPYSFCYMIGLFGLEVRFWFKESEVQDGK